MFYELNLNSPYFPYMQDTSVEDKLSIEEKEVLYRAQLAGILFSMFEGASFTEDEKNYFIYVILNKIPTEIAFNNMQRVENKQEINFNEVYYKKTKYEQYLKQGVL